MLIDGFTSFTFDDDDDDEDLAENLVAEDELEERTTVKLMDRNNVLHEGSSEDSRNESGEEDEEEFGVDSLKLINSVEASSSSEDSSSSNESEEEEQELLLSPKADEDESKADEQRKINLRNQPMYVQSLRQITRSLTVYTVSLLRHYSSNGNSSVPFEVLTMESDDFPLVDIINGTPHKDPAFSRWGDAGRGPLDILDALLHTFSVLGLPPHKKKRRGKTRGSFYTATAGSGFQRTSKLNVQVHVDDQFEEICADAVTLNQFFRTSLRVAPKASPETCKHHVGTLCQSMELHYVQLFFDQIDALSHTSAKFKNFQKSMDSQRLSELSYDRRLIFSPKLMKPDSPVMHLEKTLDEDPTRVVWMNDRVVGECVYFILCSKYSKRVTVVFRGTVTLKDWLQNVRNQRRKRPNPIEEDYPGKLDYIESLNGHSEYLLTRRRDNGRNKYDEIADKVYEYGKEMGEDFQICVTGHSMGGALSTLFAFHATTDARFKNQDAIRLYTFNSCFPGRVSFAKAFQHQEKTGKIMHMRFASKGDSIPYLKCLNDAYDFAHTGVYVQVDDPLVCKYTHDLSLWESFWVNFMGFSFFQLFWMILHPITALKSHSLEYNMACLWHGAGVLAKTDPATASMTLEQIYEKHVLDPVLDPKKED